MERIDISQFSDADIDRVLARFDQTAPELQRRVIAMALMEVANLQDALKEWRITDRSFGVNMPEIEQIPAEGG